jgi:hypothetical protein
MLIKRILIRHLGSIHHVLFIWPNKSSGHVAGQNINLLQNTECKNVVKSQSYAHLIFDRHLGHQSVTKIFSYMEYARSKYKPNTKNSTQNSSKLTELRLAILKITAILKTWEN